ncbi:MAG: PAS domain S-box protein [Acidobacteria bacterium]|nr:PAS domain S-box protein [Acidobacteriota bacterium]
MTNTNGVILIADSHPGELGELRSLLREQEYAVELVGTGRDALLAFADRRPDAVLVDTTLPDMDGVDLCERLKQADEQHDVPVLFLGDGSDIQERIDALERGGIDFIPRPFAAAEVLARVKRQVTVALARAALQESAAKFRAATESAIDAIVSADARGKILSWNRAAERLFGYVEEEMLGESLTKIIPDRYREQHNAGVERVGSGGRSRIIGSIVEIEGLHKDGHEVPVELSLTAWKLEGERYFTGILRDIAERKEAEQRFRSVTESAIDAIISSNATSTVVGWNRAAEEMFGWTADEIVGKRLETIIPKRFHEAHKGGMDRLTHTGESHVIGKTVELAAVRKDGSEFPIELSLSTWTVEADRYYTGIIRDISARKEAEDKLKEYADQLASQHEELQKRHEELERSRQALEASFKQTQKLFSAMTDNLPGAVLNNKYRLENKIASGGFGVVYEGVQLNLERKVAVKLLRPPSQEDEDMIFERFRREGVSTTRVKHPNAVSIIDLDITSGGFPYIVMEYLEGQTLGDFIKSRGALKLNTAARILADVAGVLAAAHRVGVVHRDVKPSNIFLAGNPDDPTVKVLDFGIAKLMDEPGLSSVTRTGQFVGTPSYMAPERLRPDAPESELSDVYGAGVVLYEALTGQLPIPPRKTLVQTIQAHMNSQPIPLNEVCPAVPEAFTGLVRRLLSRNLADRPSASQLQVELLDLAELPEADMKPPCLPAAHTDPTGPSEMQDAETDAWSGL